MARVKVSPLLQEARAKRKQLAEAESRRGTAATAAAAVVAAAPAPQPQGEETDAGTRAESADSRKMKEEMLAKQRRCGMFYNNNSTVKPPIKDALSKRPSKIPSHHVENGVQKRSTSL